MIQENTVDEETENIVTVDKVSPSERVPSELARTETCQAMSTTVGKRAVNWETTMFESNNEVKLQIINKSRITTLHSSFLQIAFIIPTNCIHQIH